MSRAQSRPGRPSQRQQYSKLGQKEAAVLRLIHQHCKIPRMELAKLTGSSPAAVTAIARKLIAARLIIESGRGSTHFGRKPILLSVRDDWAYLVGVDLGSFFLRVVITDMNGNVIRKAQTETQLQLGRQRVIEETFQLARRAIEESRIPWNAIKGIGVGHSGVIDVARGVVLSLPRPGQMLEWKNVPLRAMFEEEFGLPCVLEDSVRTRATAEKHFGLGAVLSDFIYIDVGMGIGAAIFIDGKIYRGAGGNAGEFGHMTVDERATRCSCGNNGCVEALASCGTIIQAARGAIEKGVDSKIRELAQSEVNRINIEIIAQAAMENDSLAIRILDDAVSREYKDPQYKEPIADGVYEPCKKHKAKADLAEMMGMIMLEDLERESQVQAAPTYAPLRTPMSTPASLDGSSGEEVTSTPINRPRPRVATAPVANTGGSVPSAQNGPRRDPTQVRTVTRDHGVAGSRRALAGRAPITSVTASSPAAGVQPRRQVVQVGEVELATPGLDLDITDDVPEDPRATRLVEAALLPDLEDDPSQA